MSTEDVTNPGSVNVADQAFDGLPSEINATDVLHPANASVRNVSGEVAAQKPVSVEQPVTVSTPATTALLTVDGDDESSVARVSVDQPVTVSVPGPPLLTIQGGTFDPQSPNTVTTTQNTVVGQTYGGSGLVPNYFV